MSTVAKGDEFEERVFLALEKEINSGRLGLQANFVKIFRRKGYYSKDREKDIIVDISIELWLPGASNYSMLWVCECKNYGKSVPVDDVEEFKSKLDQIAGKNIKGIMATRNSYQEGAMTYAKNQGIGLVRIMPSEQVTWLMHMMTGPNIQSERSISPYEFNRALKVEKYQAQERSFYAVAEGCIFGNWSSLLRHSLKCDDS